jgi:PAS domain S-box-containing protein
MLDGGKNPKGIIFALNDPLLRYEINDVLQKIKKFRVIAERRFESADQSGVGSVIDQRFDTIFKEFLDQADRVGVALQSAMESDLRRFQIIQGLLIIFCLGVSAFVAIVFRRYEKQQKQHILDLQKSEENLSTTLDSIGDAVITTDTNGYVTRMNPVAVALTGWKLAEALGQPLEKIFNIINNSTRKQVASPVTEVLNSGVIVGLANHTALITRDGEERQVADSGAPIRDADGLIVGVVLVFRDVTEIYNNDKQAIESVEKYQSLFENMNSGVAVYEVLNNGEDFIFRDLNRAGEQISNVKRADVIGQRVTAAFPGVHEFGLFEVFQRVHRTGQPYIHPISQYKDDRIVFWVENQVYKLNSGEIVAIYSDVTKRKQAEHALLEARDNAYTASHAKSEFLAVMSHEIRTPLNAMLGMTEVMQDTNIDAEQSQFLEVIGRAGNNLLTLIGDILDLSNIESGRMVLVRQPIDLVRLTQDAIDVHSQKAELKGLVFTHSIAPNTKEHFEGDSKRLRQILLNLLGNAIKFTNHGRVELQVSNPDSQSILFSVLDTGIGVPEAKQLLIFDPFSQADASNTRKHGGAGLGLALCKRLVVSMDGQLWVETGEGGKGSIFHFSIPFSSPQQHQGQTLFDPKITYNNILEESKNGANILLAEDIEENAMVVEAYLKNTPHQVDIVEDGDIAVEKIHSGEKYDMVLMDIQMPRMDGLEATRRIRDWEQKQHMEKIPILALTAHAMTGDDKKSLDAGCDGHITKPINKKRLLELINQFYPTIR